LTIVTIVPINWWMKYLTLFALVTIFGIGCSEERNYIDLKYQADSPIDDALGLTLGEVVDWDSDKRFTKKENSSNEYRYRPENAHKFPFHHYLVRRNLKTNQVEKVTGWYNHKEGDPTRWAFKNKNNFLLTLRDKYGWFTKDGSIEYFKTYEFSNGRKHQVMMITQALDKHSFVVDYKVEK
jgi:hypothetical protein